MQQLFSALEVPHKIETPPRAARGRAIPTNRLSLFSFLLIFHARCCRRTGSLRPTSGPSYLGKRPRNAPGGGEKHKRKPPRGMYINHDDIVTLASNPTAESDQLLSSMDREVVALMSQVRTAQRVRQKERESGVGGRIDWE